MPDEKFKALIVTEENDGSFRRTIGYKKFSELPANEVLIRVVYSSLNYKDALSATGHKGVTRSYPHTPGIDAAGVVAESSSPLFKPGDNVIVTGYDLGMNTSGGFGQYISVPAGWVVPLPEGLILEESMMLGTAGFTAAYALHKLLIAGQQPGDGPVLVTGATGGVGSLAVQLLAKAGFEVLAATGKPDQEPYLKAIGASAVVPRSDTDDKSEKMLLKWRWAGAIDTVGGNILATALKACKPHGNVASLGNALSAQLNTTVFPFILNGINLLGIDSATCPYPTRELLWNNLAGSWKPPRLDLIASPVALEDLNPFIDLILSGKLSGRKYVVIGGKQP